MKTLKNIKLRDVQEVYSGPEGRLWELLMGDQIHIGGMNSSMYLAEKAKIRRGSKGVDLCCASGAGMRFLVRFCGVKLMTGVDATRAMLDLAQERAQAEGLGGQLKFVQADVCATGLTAGQADFVWGEDGWCYVEDKSALIKESARLLVDGGRVAFTDWMEGDEGMSAAEAKRFLRFMKFPSLLRLGEYTDMLESAGCRVRTATDTCRFADAVDLYIGMFEDQLKYDVLRILGFDTAAADLVQHELRFTATLAKQGKIIQGLIIAEKAG